MAEDAKSAQTTATRASLKTKPPESAPVKKEEEETFRQFLWHSQRKEFLGRTGKSWCLITIFYLIFFTALAAFFWFSWLISLIFVNLDHPVKSGKGSLIFDTGPGLAIRPRPDSNLIEFEPGDAKKWIGQLESWFKKIPTKNVKECMEGSVAEKKKACLVPKDTYGPCSPDNSFGYSKSEPCILLKLNRIFHWKPQSFTKAEWKKFIKEEGKKIKIEGVSESIPIPDGLQTMIKKQIEGGSGGEKRDQIEVNAIPSESEASTTESKTVAESTGTGGENTGGQKTFDLEKNIPIWCEPDKKDKDKLDPIEYYPGPYIPSYYFPFQGQKNYQSPFVMIQLKGLKKGKEITIVCQAFAKNIKLEKATGVGYARFLVKLK